MNASLRREERKRQAASVTAKASDGAFLIADLLQGPHCPHLSLLGFYCRLLTENGVLGGGSGGTSYPGGNLAVQIDLPSLFSQAVELYETLPEGVIPSLASISAPDEYFVNAAATVSLSRQDLSTASASMMARTPISKRKAVSRRSKGHHDEEGSEDDEEDLEEEEEEEEEGADEGHEDDGVNQGNPARALEMRPCSLPGPLCLPIDFKDFNNLFGTHPLGFSKVLEGAGASSLPWGEAGPFSSAPSLPTANAGNPNKSNPMHQGVLLTVAPLDIGNCGGDSSNLHPQHLGPLSNESTATHQAGLLSSTSLTGVASGFLPLTSSASLHHHLAPSPKQSLWLSSLSTLCCGASRTDWQSEGPRGKAGPFSSDWQSEGLPVTARASVAQSMAGLLPLTSSLPLLPDLYCSNFALDTTHKSLNINRQSKTITTYPPPLKHGGGAVTGKRGRPHYNFDVADEEEEVMKIVKSGSEEDEESQMRDAAEVLHSLFHSSSSSAGQPPVNQRAQPKGAGSKVRQAPPSKKPRVASKTKAEEEEDDDEDYEFGDEDTGRYGRGGGVSKKSVKAPSAPSEVDEEGQALLSAAALHLTANHDDGWRWRKYGEKAIKGQADVMRSYYKCSQPNCGAKKVVQWSLKGGEMEPEYKGVHSHLPPAPHAAMSKRQQMVKEVDGL